MSARGFMSVVTIQGLSMIVNLFVKLHTILIRRGVAPLPLVNPALLRDPGSSAQQSQQPHSMV
jgi:hypothetical protein